MNHLTETPSTDYQDMLSDYFGLEVPLPIVEAVIALHPGYRFSYASDTDVRDSFVNGVVQYIGVNMSWPCYGDSREYKEKFYSSLNEACIKFGIKNS
jgi:hypothetical protein